MCCKYIRNYVGDTTTRKTTNGKRGYKDLSYFKPKECHYCKSTENIRWRFRYNHITKKRRYLCNKCKKAFVVDDGFWKRKKQREFIAQCLDLYVNGMSLRKVKTHIEQFSDITVSHTAISRWLKSYSVLVKSFTDGLKIETSGIYHTDEIYIKCSGDQNYFFDLIDAKSRFLVATFYDKEKGLHGAKGLFDITKKRAEKLLFVYTDGLPAYMNIIPKMWYTKRDKQCKEVQHIRIIDQHDYRNNIIERVQGTLRERIKVMRGFKNPKSTEATLELLVIWYNFIRIHQGIQMTPAEMCGIKLNLGQNKWLGLIYRSKECLAF